MYEVTSEKETYTVRIFTRPGRRLMTCTCFNGTSFCKEPTICKHKENVIVWRYIKRLEKFKNDRKK
jgi:hypothetical protein